MSLAICTNQEHIELIELFVNGNIFLRLVKPLGQFEDVFDFTQHLLKVFFYSIKVHFKQKYALFYFTKKNVLFHNKFRSFRNFFTKLFYR